MTKANWKEAPHDAETYEHYRDLKRFCKKGFYFDDRFKSWVPKAFPASWTILEHRPQPDRKTVKDAVEHYNGVWPCEDKNEIWHTDIISPDITHNYPVCTREEFEAEARRLDPRNWDVLIDSPEGEDEGWTHTYNDDNCYIKVDELDQDGFFVVMTETDGYMLVEPADIKPIKPTITKAEFLLLENARQYFDIDPKDFAKFMNDYEVK